MKIFNRLMRNQRGATVAIAMAIAFILIAFSFGIASVVDNTNLTIKAFKESSQAQLVAESVMEQLLLATDGLGPGVNISEDECDILIGEGNYQAKYDGIEIRCEVKGLHDSDDLVEGVYTVPSKGTGDAGENCSPLEEYDELDHPCNWGKLKFGNSVNSRVVVPLYYEYVTYVEEGKITTSTVNASDFMDFSSSNGFQIKVRAACDGGYDENGDCASRFQLDDGGPPYVVDENETIVNWQITGECDGEGCGLRADNKIYEDFLGRSLRFITNSEVHEEFVNASDSAVAFDSNGFTFASEEFELANFLNGGAGKNSRGDDIVADLIERPVLQLSLISSGLVSVDSESVPYLEYQVRLLEPGPGSQQIYRVEVYYEGQAYKIERALDQEKNVIDFAVQG